MPASVFSLSTKLDYDNKTAIRHEKRQSFCNVCHSSGRLREGFRKGGSDSDSVAEEIPADVTASAGKQEACLTKDSIGAITIGMDINAVPDSVPGLYVRKVNGASPDAVTIDFEDEDGERFIAYDFGEGKIDVINLIGSDVKVKPSRGFRNRRFFQQSAGIAGCAD